MTTHSRPHSNPHGATPPAQRGFTLVELLVVVAVIALLIGLLLPALSKARAAGYQAKGLSTQKQLGLAMITYGNSNDFAIPGLNTTGRNIQAVLSNDATRLDKDPCRPTQNFDWMTPALCGETNLPYARGERMVSLFRDFADPANTQVFQKADVNGGGTGQSPTLDETLNNIGSMPAPSYLMPLTFQYAGGANPNPAPDQTNTIPYTQPDNSRNTCALPDGYRPRQDKVGQSASKVALADGYLDVFTTASTIKLEAAPWVQPDDLMGGGFATEPPMRKDAPSYRADGQNIKLSYRHSGRMNVVYWDNHGEAISDDASRNPHIWYPTNSQFKNVNADTRCAGFFGTNQNYPAKIN